MRHGLNSMLVNAAAERLTLLVNHVVAAEPVAMQRLRAHQGRCISFSFDRWPSLLPALPATAWRITPAGLVEWCGPDVALACDLRVTVDASNPALAMVQALAGTRPQVDVSGDAALATDLNWLFDNLRWDVQDDLERVLGPGPARELSRLGGAVATGVRVLARGATDWVGRARDGEAGRNSADGAAGSAPR